MSDPRVLIVDDCANVCGAWSAAFAKEGFEVATATHPTDALDLFTMRRPDVVLTDYMMPGMDGLQLMQELKRREPDIPVIMISGTNDVRAAVQAIKEEAFDFLTKPVPVAQIISTIRQAMQRREPKVSTFNNKIAHDIIPGAYPLSELTVYGNLDQYSTTRIIREVHTLMSDEALRSGVIWNLGRVEYINNVGLNAMVDLFEDSRKRGYSMCCAPVSDIVRNYLRTLGYLDYFKVTPSKEDAVWLLQDAARAS